MLLATPEGAFSPTPPNLKSDLNFFPQVGQAMTTPPTCFGKRSCCPQSGHFFSVNSDIIIYYTGT